MLLLTVASNGINAHVSIGDELAAAIQHFPNFCGMVHYILIILLSLLSVLLSYTLLFIIDSVLTYCRSIYI